VSRRGITSLQVLAAAAALASCGGVALNAPDASPAAADVGSAVDAGGVDVDVRVDVVAERVGEASDVGGRPLVSCSGAELGVDVEQCASDCHFAICTTSDAQLVGCARTAGAFYCPVHGPDFVKPACVERCP